MRSIIKKKKNILLGILFIAIIICTPFLFGEEGCDDGLNEVANSVDQNIQNDANNSNVKDPYGLNLTADDMRGLLQLQKTHRITEAQAKEVALQSAQELDKNSNARTERSVSGVSTIYYSNGEKTTNARVTETDPSAFPIYVVNFANDLGFSIVGGDERLGDPVLFEAEKGNYNAEYFDDDETPENEQTSEQKVRHLFKELIPAYIERKIEEENRIREPLLLAAIEKINAKVPDSLKIGISNNQNGREIIRHLFFDGYYYIFVEETTFTIDSSTFHTLYENPLVTHNEIIISLGPLTLTTWGQCIPYNNNLSSGCWGFTCGDPDGRVSAGSMPTCEGMLAAYWERPTTYNWASMKTSPSASNLTTAGQNAVAQLIQVIHSAEGATSSCVQGTNAHLNLNFFRNNNFTVPAAVSYSDALVRASLDNRRPVPIRATRWNDDRYRYFWLLDGYITMGTVERYTLMRIGGSCTPVNNRMPANCVFFNGLIVSSITKIHCNWGLDGLYNGYCVSGVFNPTISDGDLNGSGTTTSTATGYSNLMIVPNLRPN